MPEDIVPPPAAPATLVLPPVIPDDPVFTPASMRAELLGQQTRVRVSIRSSFCQEIGGQLEPGPLHKFVFGRRLFALQLYLLLMCIARSKPWDKKMPATSWALTLDRSGPSAESTVSRNWKWLRENNLVETKREGRDLRVFRRDETGKDTEYTKPTSKFFYLPFAFFTEGWHTKLDLAETTVMLIALSKSTSKPWFQLPTERASDWYGISADTLERGLEGLETHGMLAIHRRQVRDHRARFNTVTINDYTLLGSLQRWKPTEVPS